MSNQRSSMDSITATQAAERALEAWQNGYEVHAVYHLMDVVAMDSSNKNYVGTVINAMMAKNYGAVIEQMNVLIGITEV